MPGKVATRLFEAAEAQHGYITAAQATAEGIDYRTLGMMARRGIVERLSRGVYRLSQYPPFRHGQYMEATLWPQDGVPAVLSHESALEFHGMSDASPNRVHITVPRSHRIRRAIPRHLVVHHEPLLPDDVEMLDAVRVTTPFRTIQDCIRAHLSTRLVQQAIEDGRRSGKLTQRQAVELKRERHP
jgi:predicted transcriptional regulator of viral defense system